MIVKFINPLTLKTLIWSVYLFNMIMNFIYTTVVEEDQKALFSIPTTVRCKEGATPFPGFLHLLLINTL